MLRQVRAGGLRRGRQGEAHRREVDFQRLLRQLHLRQLEWNCQ